MSYAGVELTLLEFVADIMLNVCDVTAPDRMLRYQGHLPNDCCSEAGTLSISWDQLFPSTEFPVNAANRPNPCTAFPVVPMSIRYVRCWPEPEVDSNGVTLIDPSWDENAAGLLDIASCVSNAFLRLQCGTPNADDPIVQEAAQALKDEGMRFFMWKGTQPILPQGGCAGVLWSTAVTITREGTGS